MNLVFNEYINFLKDKGLDNNLYNLEEGYYWQDRQIIKAYDKEGNIHKVLRIKIDDDFKITFTGYKKENFEIESWNETVIRNKDRLKELENESRKLITLQTLKYSDYILSILTSGGKDSTVVKHLVENRFKNTEVIFNNTTLDCADTYEYIKKIPNVQVITPEEGFYQWRNRLDFVPTRFSRACCTIFKEGAMVDNLDKNSKRLFFLGMRNEESSTRSEYGDTIHGQMINGAIENGKVFYLLENGLKSIYGFIYSNIIFL